MSSGRNVKVHYAGCDNDQRALAVLVSCGVRYRLFTSYPFIKGTDSHGDFRVADLAEARMGWEHVIVDSGLFTMMFGSDRSTPNAKVMQAMHDRDGEARLMRRCIVSTLVGEMADAAVFNLCMFSFVLPWEVIAGTVVSYGLAKVLYETVMYPVTQLVIKRVKALPQG